MRKTQISVSGFMSNYTEYANREEWLANRIHTLGASEVASALGMGFVSQLDLWKEKTGRKARTDLSENERVQYGTAAEEHLRGLFALQFKDKYDVEYHAYRVYQHEKYDFLTATLDGELFRKADGKHGILEVKTAWIMSGRDLEQWENNSIPQHYFVQICDQLGVTGFDFVVLQAQLIFQDGKSEIRQYYIERDEVQDEIAYVEQEAVKFWGYVTSGKQPPTVLEI